MAEEILCVRMPFNHCKIFWSDNFVYIGSANFSLRSNNNYEAGFTSTNLEVINKVINEYGIDEELATRDVNTFINKLIEAVYTSYNKMSK